MIYYLFEDNEESVLSKFLLEGFVTDREHKIKFVGSNSKLKSTAEGYLKEGAEVIAFLDTVPGNIAIETIYYELLDVQAQYDSFTLVPIVCAEYYLLKSLRQWQFGPKVTELSNCLDKNPYFHEDFMINKNSTEGEPKYESFERYCKGIIDKYGNWCIRFKDSSKSDAKADCSKATGLYYSVDCTCCCKRDFCESMLKDTKIYNLLRAYPCVPVCTKYPNSTRAMSKVQLSQICDELIDEYNDFSKRLKSSVDDSEVRFFRTLIKPSEYCK